MASGRLQLKELLSPGGITAMTIDSTGRITKPVIPCANVNLTTDTVGSDTTSNYPIFIFNATTLNQGSHYNTATGIFTCPVAGIYQVTAYGMDKNGGASGAFYLHVRLDGTVVGNPGGSYTASASHAGASITKLISCTAGQELSIGYYASSGALSGYCGATFMLVG